MALSAQLQQVNNWSIWCDITDHSHQTQLKQCIVTAHWPTNGLQRLILRITSQQLIMFCHQARTHARTRTLAYSDNIHILLYCRPKYNVYFKKTLHRREPRWDPVFILWTPFFSNQWGPRTLVFYALARTLLFIILCRFA